MCPQVWPFWKHSQARIWTLYVRGLKLSFMRGPHFNKKRLAGHIKRKNVSAGRNRRLKVPLYYKNSSLSNNLSYFNDVAGHTNTSNGPHAARGPCVWDPCSTCRTQFDYLFLTPHLRLYNAWMTMIKGAIHIIRNIWGGPGVRGWVCHQITQGRGRVSTKMSRVIFRPYLN